jgi:hypothetical protein
VILYEPETPTLFLFERRAEMQENIERLKEITGEIDELFTEAIDIVSGRSESLDSAVVRLQRDSNETLEEAILEMENELELPPDDEEEEEIDDDEIDKLPME